MLKKLIKHEFKATYRFYVPIYIALAALVALACIFLTVIDHFDVNEMFLSITLPLGAIVGFLAIIFTVLSPYIFICLRFYRSTATREGYLTFTLPASTNQILFSKFLVSFLWAVITTAVTLFALFVLCVVGFDSDITFMAIRQFLRSETFDFMTIFSFFTGYINSILAIYAAISLGAICTRSPCHRFHCFLCSHLHGAADCQPCCTDSCYDQYQHFFRSSLTELFRYRNVNHNIPYHFRCIFSYILRYFRTYFRPQIEFAMIIVCDKTTLEKPLTALTAGGFSIFITSSIFPRLFVSARYKTLR